MRVVVQRVRSAAVTVGVEPVAAIGEGLVALVGVGRADTAGDATAMGRKLAHLRLFPDGDRDFHRSLADTGGSLLVVSQFTLLGDTRRGNRPSWAPAADREQAEPIVALVAEAARREGVAVACGRFGAQMLVRIDNDGPVTVILGEEGLA